VDVAGFADLSRSWERHLRASGSKPTTVEVYLRAVRQYAEHAGAKAEVDRSTLVDFLADLAGRSSAATVRVRSRALSLFCGWLVAEEELPDNPLRDYKAPKVNIAPVPLLTEDQLTAMLLATRGEADEFARRRAEAILRVFLDTGCRLSEVANLRLADVDLNAETLAVRGKGDKVRRVPVGSRTLAALDRYVRTRRKHRLAAEGALWLGLRGPLGDDGVDTILRRLADRAGVEGFHAHRLRHTFAHRWLAAGGQERNLMAVAGWSSPAMLARYGASLAEQRAMDEAKRLELGQL
jgi:site-specific recombinase XerD